MRWQDLDGRDDNELVAGLLGRHWRMPDVGAVHVDDKVFEDARGPVARLTWMVGGLASLLTRWPSEETTH